MKKVKKITKLLRLIEEERYNIKELAKKIYGNSEVKAQVYLGANLSFLRKRGIPVYPQGNNGIVKVPSNMEEWRLTNQRDFSRKRGSLMMYMRLVRATLLEEPKLRKEILPLLNNLKIIASMGQVKKLYGNETNKYQLTEARSKTTKTGNK